MNETCLVSLIDISFTLGDALTVGMSYLFILYFVHFVVPMGSSPMGNSGRFPQGNPAATESRYPALTD